MLQQSFTGDLIKSTLTVVISAAAGWLLSSINKVSRKDLETELKRIEEALADQKRQISKAFEQNSHMVTRTEFREAIEEIRRGFEKQFVDLKADMRAAITDLRDFLKK